MSFLLVIWVTLGAAAGSCHAVSLWRQAHRGSAGQAAEGVARRCLLAVGATASGWAGGLLPAFAGWGIGFATAIAWLSGSGKP